MALLGEFDSVASVVEQGLLQPRRVTQQMGRQGGDQSRQLQVFVMGTVLKHGDDVAEQVIQVTVLL